MTRYPKKLPAQRLRQLFLFLLLTIAGAVVALYLFGRAGRGGSGASARSGVADTVPSAGQLTTGEGFDQEVTHEGERLFLIHADTYEEDQENTYRFEGVRIEWDREDGEPIVLRGARGVFNVESNEASIRGAVRVEGPNHLILETEGLELQRDGRWLVSSAPVVVQLGENLSGHAQQFKVNLRRNIIQLAGKVVLRSMEENPQESIHLKCRMLTFERDHRLIRAEDNVELKQGADRIRARRVGLLLTEDESAIQLVRARWRVTGVLKGNQNEEAESDDQREINFRANQLTVQMDPGTRYKKPQHMELTGRENKPAVVQIQGPLKTQRLIAARLIGGYVNGELSRAESESSIQIIEYGNQDPEKITRRATALGGGATFEAGGELSTLFLIGDVEYQDELHQAHGDQAEVDVDNEVIHFEGEPAVLMSQRGRFEAPSIVDDRRAEQVHASGGIRVMMAPSAAVSLSKAALSKEPFQVEAEEGFWRQSPDRFQFLGNVRAWQGENVLLSDRLQGEVLGQTLRAEGSVKTLWVQARALEEGEVLPLEVTSALMDYREPAGKLAYSGDVRLRQHNRTLGCDNLEINLDEAGEMQTADCRGGVTIQDPTTHRSVSGESATYEMDGDTIKVLGDPVTLVDVNGAQIQGPTLVYNIRSGAAQMTRGPSEPQTIPVTTDPDPNSDLDSPQT